MLTNEWIGGHLFGVLDVGGSIFVHVFGAYFGLAVSRVLYRWEYGVRDFNTLKFTTKTTDLFSMIGTIFLWMYWPSFNSALAAEELQQRAVMNTYFALAACCVVTFICSYLFHGGKFSMVSFHPIFCWRWYKRKIQWIPKYVVSCWHRIWLPGKFEIHEISSAGFAFSCDWPPIVFHRYHHQYTPQLILKI